VSSSFTDLAFLWGETQGCGTKHLPKDVQGTAHEMLAEEVCFVLYNQVT